MSSKKSSTKKQKTNIVKDQIVDYMVLYSKDMNNYTSSLTRSRQNRNELQRQIGQAIDNGWQPFGSVSIGTTGKLSDTIVFAQAMVIYE